MEDEGSSTHVPPSFAQLLRTSISNNGGEIEPTLVDRRGLHSAPSATGRVSLAGERTRLLSSDDNAAIEAGPWDDSKAALVVVVDNDAAASAVVVRDMVDQIYY